MVTSFEQLCHVSRIVHLLQASYDFRKAGVVAVVVGWSLVRRCGLSYYLYPRPMPRKCLHVFVRDRRLGTRVQNVFHRLLALPHGTVHPRSSAERFDIGLLCPLGFTESSVLCRLLPAWAWQQLPIYAPLQRPLLVITLPVFLCHLRTHRSQTMPHELFVTTTTRAFDRYYGRALFVGGMRQMLLNSIWASGVGCRFCTLPNLTRFSTPRI